MIRTIRDNLSTSAISMGGVPAVPTGRMASSDCEAIVALGWILARIRAEPIRSSRSEATSMTCSAADGHQAAIAQRRIRLQDARLRLSWNGRRDWLRG